MSGNSVSLGIAWAQEQWPAAVARILPILFYVAGLITGRLLIHIGARLEIKRVATVAFMLESLLLGIVMSLGHATDAMSSDARGQYVAVSLLALAMGIQNSILTRFSSLTLHTGFVTGTLVKYAEQLVKSAVWIRDSFQAGNTLPAVLRQLTKQSSFRVSLLLALAWTAYVVGAAAGALSRSVMRANSLALAIAGLGLLVVVDLLSPLAWREEIEGIEPP
jgi:uncharacterized membrane protein YoaK (UPF0700 family)